MQLAPHFSLAEMTVTNHRDIDNSLDPLNSAHKEIIEHLRIVAQGLEAIRQHFNTPIVVTSGFRCLALNAAVGSKPTSAHVVGYAADFMPVGWTALSACQRIAELTVAGELFAYDQLIYEHPASSKWVHISFAPRLRMENLTIDRAGTHTGFVDNP